VIRKRQNGTYHCDGRGCGYPLEWFALDPEEGDAEGEWVCLDCNASMYAARPISSALQEASRD
jgi:hypothetical protein